MDLWSVVGSPKSRNLSSQPEIDSKLRLQNTNQDASGTVQKFGQLGYGCKSEKDCGMRRRPWTLEFGWDCHVGQQLIMEERWRRWGGVAIICLGPQSTCIEVLTVNGSILCSMYRLVPLLLFGNDDKWTYPNMTLGGGGTSCELLPFGRLHP